MLNEDFEEYRKRLMEDEKNNMNKGTVSVLGIILLVFSYYLWFGFWKINSQMVLSGIVGIMGLITFYTGVFGKKVSEMSDDELKKTMKMRNKLLKIMLSHKKK